MNAALEILEKLATSRCGVGSGPGGVGPRVPPQIHPHPGHCLGRSRNESHPIERPLWIRRWRKCTSRAASCCCGREGRSGARRVSESPRHRARGPWRRSSAPPLRRAPPAPFRGGKGVPPGGLHAAALLGRLQPHGRLLLPSGKVPRGRRHVRKSRPAHAGQRARLQQPGRRLQADGTLRQGAAGARKLGPDRAERRRLHQPREPGVLPRTVSGSRFRLSRKRRASAPPSRSTGPTSATRIVGPRTCAPDPSRRTGKRSSWASNSSRSTRGTARCT